MTANSCSALAASVFAIVALVQFVRAVNGWPRGFEDDEHLRARRAQR